MDVKRWCWFREATINGIYDDIVKYKRRNNIALGTSAWSKGVYTDFFKVPPCKKKDNFCKLADRTCWIEELLEKCIDPSNEEEDAVHCMIDYLLRRPESKTRDALLEAGVIPSILDPFEVAATMEKVNLGVGQWRELVKCLKTFLGLKQISVSEKLVTLLGADHGKVTSGVFMFQKEVGQRKIPIRWWTMDPKNEILLCLNDFAN